MHKAGGYISGLQAGHSPCKVHGEYVTVLQDCHPNVMEGRGCHSINAAQLPKRFYYALQHALYTFHFQSILQNAILPQSKPWKSDPR